MSVALNEALTLARLGYPLIRLIANTKEPEDRNWPALATTNEDIIRLWFDTSIFGEPNIGIATGWHDHLGYAIVVVDLDVKGEADGVANWQSLCDQHGAPPKTLAARTPSGGWHFVYKSPHRIKRAIGKLAPGIDIIAERSFFVVAPSTINNRAYKWVNTPIAPHDLATLPQWVVDACDAYKPKSQDPQISVIQTMDAEIAIDQGERFLKSLPPVGEGSRNNALSVVAMKLHDFGLSPARAADLVLEHWRCEPMLDHEEVIACVNSSYNSAESPIGSTSLQVFAEQPLSTKLGLEAFVDFDESHLPAREWVIYGLLAVGYLTLIVAPPGAGKSTISFLIATAIATGRGEILDAELRGPRGVTVIANNEDELPEMRRRQLACMKHFSVEPADMFIDGKPALYLRSGQVERLLIAIKGGPDGQRVIPQMVDELVNELVSVGARLFVVDPLAEIHGLDENDNMQMAQVAAILRTIAQRARVAVLGIHHTRKLPAGSSEGHAGNLDSGRGASAIMGVARFVFTLFGLSSKDAKKWGVAEEERHLFVRFDGAKANLALVTGKPKFLKRLSSDINGEAVGVLAPVDLKEQFEPSEDSAMVRDIVSVVEGAGVESIRSSVRARVKAEKGTAIEHAMLIQGVVAGLLRLPAYSEIKSDTLGKRVKTAIDGGETVSDGWVVGAEKTTENSAARWCIYLRRNSESIFD